MYDSFSDLRFRGVEIYLDDIVIHTKTGDEHFVLLEDVFKRIDMHGLAINIKKTHFLCKSIRYLGHVISAEGISPDPCKLAIVKALQDQ